MFEQFGFETTTPQQAAVWFALAVGVIFGILGQITKFCFRRSLIGEDRRAAKGVWLTALAFAVLGTQVAVAMGAGSALPNTALWCRMCPIWRLALAGCFLARGWC